MIVIDAPALLGVAAIITSLSALVWSIRRKAGEGPRAGCNDDARGGRHARLDQRDDLEIVVRCQQRTDETPADEARKAGDERGAGQATPARG